MNLLHGTWVPHDGTQFDNQGKFVVWLETTGDGTDLPPGIHSAHLATDKALTKSVETQDFFAIADG